MAPLREATQAVISKVGAIYSPEIVDAEVKRYFTALGMDSSYFRLYKAEDIAHHIQGFIAAKRMAALSNLQSKDELFFRIQKPNNVIYFCAYTPQVVLKAEREIQEEMNKNTRPGLGYSIRSHISEGPHTEGGSGARLCVYDVTWSEYPEGAEKESGFAGMCTKEFTRTKPAEIAHRYREIVEELCKNKKLRPVVKVIEADATESGHALTLVAYGTRSNYLPHISLLSQQIGLNINRKYVEAFDGNIEVHALYTDASTRAKLRQFNDNIGMLGLIPVHLHPSLQRGFRDGNIDARSLLYIHAATTFAYYFTENVSEEFVFLKRTFEEKDSPVNLSRLQRMSEKLWKEAITMDRIIKLAVDHLPLCSLLYDDFVQKTTTPGAPNAVNDAIRSAINSTITDPTEAVIFQSFIAFNESVVKTNFHKAEKSAISFRIDCSFMKKLGYMEVPFGLFLLVGSTFTGFHIRFRDIARGGVRLVSPLTKQAHKAAFKTLIQENLNLALTQQRKNKDIPEGGSKGVLIVIPAATKDMREMAYLQYVDSLCDVILRNQPEVVDRLGREEMIFLGPDENTGNDEYPDKAMMLAEERHYPYFKSFTTGKSPHNGGIPHDTYGMTTTGIVAYKDCIRETYKLDEKKVTKLQTAGPNGDLGGNEIKMSCDKTIAIVDGDAVLFDPNGLNRTELMRLVTNRLTAKSFDRKQLSCKEAYMVYEKSPGDTIIATGDSDSGKNLPDGTVVEKFDSFRDTFIFTQSSDFFVPCGGRPKTVDVTNVHRMLLEPKQLTGDVMMQTKSDNVGNLRYRYIVEGANLFITPEARIALENYGVVLFPDASANKGGVTSSSFEVLAALALSKEEHTKLMLVPRTPVGAPPSDFFVKYVAGIHSIITRNCRREFECIEKEHTRLKGTLQRSLISNQLSLRINVLNSRILNSGMWKDAYLRESVLKRSLPPVLLQQVPIETIMKRVPEAYQSAIFNAYVASNYVYGVGLVEDESAFSRFMRTMA
jgi:glutamate dehydrogenase